MEWYYLIIVSLIGEIKIKTEIIKIITILKTIIKNIITISISISILILSSLISFAQPHPNHANYLNPNTHTWEC